jgi:DNA modification methylase
VAREYDGFKREYDDLKREYDDLKREWYATRAPFDNTHALMTDVWKFETMRGEDRPDHPTPKPIAIIERIIKTSGTDDAPTFVPFAGTCPEMVACQNLGCKCRAIEIEPKYVAVCLQRMQDAFPGIEIVKIE